MLRCPAETNLGFPGFGPLALGLSSWGDISPASHENWHLRRATCTRQRERLASLNIPDATHCLSMLVLLSASLSLLQAFLGRVQLVALSALLSPLGRREIFSP